jgi:hypothetical protein
VSWIIERIGVRAIEQVLLNVLLVGEVGRSGEIVRSDSFGIFLLVWFAKNDVY